MAIRSGFFNSVNGDRKYDARRFAEYFASFIGNGIFPNPSTNLQVVAQTIPDMTVIVRPGKAWINGYILINDDDYILQLEPADGVLNRIDRVVARYDTADREIRLEVKKGTFASSPVAPALQRDVDAYELALADIYVAAGVVSITQANITDLRLNTELCGIVHGTVEQVDTTTLFDQYLSWYQQTTTQLETDFNTWFATIQDVLDGDTAGNLLNLINANAAAITTMKGAGELAEKANKSVVDAHLADNTPHREAVSIERKNPDDDGIFKLIEFRRPDGTLFKTSQLNGTSPYNSRTVKYYDKNENLMQTVEYSITYSNDEVVSEVIISA